MKIGDIVRIKNTDIIGKIIAIGKHGLILISSDNLRAFDRTVYYPEELEEFEKVC